MPSRAMLYEFLIILLYFKLELSDADTNHTIYLLLMQIKKNVSITHFEGTYP